MANMGLGNTQQGAAQQQQNQLFMEQNGNSFQFNNLQQQQQQFAQFMNQNGLGQMQQNQMIGGFTSPSDDTTNNANSGSPMVVGTHHFNPNWVQNSSSTPSMASGNPSFESFTQSQTPVMLNSQNQFLDNMQNSFMGNSLMPLMSDLSMQPPFFPTPPMGNAQTPFMSNTEASTMSDSQGQGFVQNMSGLRATAPSFTPAQNSHVPQQSAVSMANMTPQMQAHMQQMEMRINQQQAIINSMMMRQSGSSAQSNSQHGPAFQMQQTSTTQIPSPRASTPGTPAAQDSTAQSLSVQSPTVQTSTNEHIAVQSPTVASPTTQSSSSRGGNTIQTVPAPSANPDSMTEQGSRANQRDSSLTQIPGVMSTDLATNPRTPLLPEDVRPPHAPPPPQHKLQDFLGDQSSTSQTSPTQDSSAQEPSTPASSNGFSSFEDWSKQRVYAPGIFAPRRSDGPEKISQKEKKLREAEDKGEQVFPSKRRVVRIDPEDPRLVRDEDGLPITPQGDRYNIYYLPGPKEIDTAEINRLLAEIRAEKKNVMDEAARTGEPIQNSKSTKRNRKSKTRVLKTPSENIVNKKRRKTTTTTTTTTKATSTPKVAGDAHLAATLSVQPSLNNGPIPHISMDPFIIQSSTALPTQFTRGDVFNQQALMTSFAPQAVLDSDLTQSPTAGNTQPLATGGDSTLQFLQENSFTSQTTYEQPTANLADNDYTSQPFNLSEDSAMQSAEDFTNINDHSLEIPADLDPMLVGTGNTLDEDLHFDTEPFAQFYPTQSGSSHPPSTPVSDSGAAMTDDHGLLSVSTWLAANPGDDATPHTSDPSMSAPYPEIVKTCHPDVSLGHNDTLSEPVDEISKFLQDDEQGTQLRKVSNELDRPPPEQTDMRVHIAGIPNPPNRDLDAECATLIEHSRAGGELSHNDRTTLLLIARTDPSSDVDAVNRQTAGVTEDMSSADILASGDDVAPNIFADLEAIPENNLQDPDATAGNDNTMFPVTGCSDFSSSSATGPASNWPPAAPNVSLAQMPYSPVVASQETQDAPFQLPQGPEFHPHDPNNNLFTSEGGFLNPVALNQTTTTTLPTFTSTTTLTPAATANTTKTGHNKRKADEDTSAAPKKKARTKKAPVPQLALPQCEVRFGPGSQQ
ncbi:hypothetical protein FPANT_5226 [Fusarium pseudoanthophilum]|uniref:Uncharacterized protein n=1 Tax=Fusarium pseudoanthophilum TaxID=48495 RepID=A0A8H5UPV5_9HYPO|nr:hypothetical protein FPANT_5226 [Fusarium pseudoanthophilum]